MLRVVENSPRTDLWRRCSAAGTLLLLLGLACAVTGCTRSRAPAIDTTDLELHELAELILAANGEYFVDPTVTPAHGIPPTAWNPRLPTRWSFSNPTEWGYGLQFRIALAERGHLEIEAARGGILAALETMEALQLTPGQSEQGTFYQFYHLYDVDQTTPRVRKAESDQVPSGDCMLLWFSLAVTEGWARTRGDEEIATLAKRIRDRMRFGHYVEQVGSAWYFKHLVDASSGELSDSGWNVFADEGGLIVIGLYLAGQVDEGMFLRLVDSQLRHSATFDGIAVREAPWFSAAFTWSMRELAGWRMHPVYRDQSFVPGLRAHKAWADRVGVEHAGFSDAMSQSDEGVPYVGLYTPPNLGDNDGSRTVRSVVPHGLFVPLLAWDALDGELQSRVEADIRDWVGDDAGYVHTTGKTPLGMEVLSSPRRDDLDYRGPRPDGRPTFEALSHAYSGLSAFTWLQRRDGLPDLHEWLLAADGLAPRVARVHQLLYPAEHERPMVVSWTRVELGFAPYGLSSDGHRVAAWHAGGVATSDDGLSWSPLLPDEHLGVIQDVHISPDGLLVAADGRLLRVGDAQRRAELLFDPGEGLIGEVRVSVPPRIDGASSAKQQVWLLFDAPDGAVDSVWRSTSEGVWVRVTGELPPDSTWWAVFGDPLLPDSCYLTGDAGGAWTGLVTRDGGASWQAAREPVVGIRRVGPDGPSIIFGPWHHVAGGLGTWIPNNITLTAVASQAGRDGHVFGATFDGAWVYRQRDWRPVGLRGVHLAGIAVTHDAIYALTAGGELHRGTWTLGP